MKPINHDIRIDRARGMRVAAARGFTLVEILIVVVILGILAAIVIPQFSSAADASRESSLKMDLNRIRQQIEVYKSHHNDNPPTLAGIVDQLTQASDVDGNTAAPGTAGFNYGPYLRELPINPQSGGKEIGDGEPGSSDWYYDEDTGDFRANDSEESREF